MNSSAGMIREALLEGTSEAERFRLLVEAVSDYAIYMLDPNGIVSSWNAGAERIKGYKASEIVGQSFANFYEQADRTAGIPRVTVSSRPKAGVCARTAAASGHSPSSTPSTTTATS
jgi:PAS domain-containing protein